MNVDKNCLEKGELAAPYIEDLKRRISQVFTAHNSLLNATSAASADKGSNNSSSKKTTKVLQ